MNKKYDFAVIIGRFQPVHRGHRPTFNKAFEIAEHVICVIGSSNMPRTIKNPFTAEERKEMILGAIDPDMRDRISFVEAEDTLYQDQEWFRTVKSSVFDVVSSKGPGKRMTELEDILSEHLDVVDRKSVEQVIHLHGGSDDFGRACLEWLELNSLPEPTRKTCILGHEKDNSSFYLRNFADWDFVDTGAWVGDAKHDLPVSATHIRELMFDRKLGYASSNLTQSTVDYINEWIEKFEEAFLSLVEEYKYINEYKKQTQTGPYEVQFITTDAVVVHGDEVLLIRRGQQPGKGLWALPGGFANSDQTLFESCIRELKEETKIGLPVKVIKGSFREEKIFDHPERSQRGRTISMAYLFVLDPSQTRPPVKGADDAVQAWWFSLDQIYNMRDQLFEDHYDIIRYLMSRV